MGQNRIRALITVLDLPSAGSGVRRVSALNKSALQTALSVTALGSFLFIQSHKFTF